MNVIAIHKTTGDIAYLVDTLSDNYKDKTAYFKISGIRSTYYLTR